MSRVTYCVLTTVSLPAAVLDVERPQGLDKHFRDDELGHHLHAWCSHHIAGVVGTFLERTALLGSACRVEITTVWTPNGFT